MFRTKTWPLVASSAEYKDIEPWLEENRCPFMYDNDSVETANVYGIYRYVNDDDEDQNYEGEFKDGKFHGQGKYTCFVGDVYEGDFKKGKYHGQGKYTYDVGEVYEGGWRDNLKYGYGKYTHANGVLFQGYWVNDEAQSSGTQTWPNGDCYIGDFDITVNDDDIINWIYKRHGDGKCIYVNGSIYTGQWDNDKRHGYGTQTWPDGREYRGYWSNDKPDGVEGHFSYPDGTVYEGQFKNGQYLDPIDMNYY